MPLDPLHTFNYYSSAIEGEDSSEEEERFSLSRSLCLVHIICSKENFRIRSVVSATVSPHDSSERVEVERLRRGKLIGEDLISNLDRVVSLVVGCARAGGAQEGKEGKIVNVRRVTPDFMKSNIHGEGRGPKVNVEMFDS